MSGQTIPWAGIKAAIATKLAAVSGVNSGTSTDLEGLGEMPSIKVTGITSMDIDASMGSQEFVNADINVDLLIARPGPITNAIASSDSIIEGCRIAAQSDVDLGYPALVRFSQITRVEVGEMEYAGEQVFGAKMTYRVECWDSSVVRTA